MYSLGTGQERFTIYKGTVPYVILLKYSLTMTEVELIRFARTMVILLNKASNA